MERFNALGRGAQLMLIAAVLLLIDLFLPWQDFDVGGLADEFGVDATFSGWRGVGAILGIVTIALLVWLGLRLANVEPRLPFSSALVTTALGALVLVLGVVKWITIVDDEATIWAWIGLVLAILIAAGAWLVMQAAGGMDSLRGEMAGMTAGGSAAAAAAEAPPPAPSEPMEAPPPAPEASYGTPPEPTSEAPAEDATAGEGDAPEDRAP